MLFRETYNFTFPGNKDLLTQSLKDLSKTDLHEGDHAYSVEFSWNQFIVTVRAKMFQRTSFTADAYIQLKELSDDLTQVDVKIKFSEITWILLVFIQMGIISGSLFVPEFNSWIRIGLMIGVSGAWNFIIWLTLFLESKKLKKVVGQLFNLAAEKI